MLTGSKTVHEMSVATGIVNVVRSKLTELAPCRLTALQLSLGELSGIDRDSLRFALDTLLADADYNGVEVRFELSLAVFECSACNWQGPLESFALTCPECAGHDLDIIQGQDVSLESIEVE